MQNLFVEISCLAIMVDKNERNIPIDNVRKTSLYQCY